MKTKKKGTKVAHIAVNSDGVRSGEESTLGVSRGQAKTPMTVRDQLQFVYLQQQRNHRELVDVLVKGFASQQALIQSLPKESLTKEQIDVKLIQIAQVFDEVFARFLQQQPDRSGLPDRFARTWPRLYRFIFGQEN